MRTKKSMKNFIVGTIFSVLIALIGLFKSKLFLTYLGDEQTGIYQLFSQIYSYISLIDAGLTSSLLYQLYKPISENDYKKVNSILLSGRKYFNIMGVIILAIGLVLSFKIDFFLKESSISMLYIQLSFILFIIASTLNYAVTARKTLFEAEQSLYYVYYVVYGTMILKAILEIVLIINGYKLFSLMVLFLVVSIIQNLIMYLISKKKHKYIDYNVEPDNSFKKQANNLIVQRIGGLVFNNTDVILISKLIGSGSIVIYTNYNYIVNSLLNIFKKIGSSSLASIGNLLVVEKEKARKVFYEYNAFCYYIGLIISIPLLFAINPFIKIFYGEKYLLPLLGVICFIIIFFIKIIIMSLDVFISALGYFDKIKKSILVEIVINIVLSIILLNKIGISGVLLATVISYFIGSLNFYPKILNNNYFKDNKINYYKQSFKLLAIAVLSIIVCYYISKLFVLNNLLVWFLYGLVIFIINFIIITFYFVLIKEDVFINRFKKIILEKIKR